MKQRRILLIITIALFILSSTTYSQRKRGMMFAIVGDVGFTGGAGVAMFNNKVLKNDNFIKMPTIAPNYSYGGHAGLSYMGNQPKFTMFTVSGEYVINTAVPQIKEIDALGDGSELYGKTINYKSTDLLILGKVTYFFGLDGDKPIYFEGGVKYSTLGSVTESNNLDNPDYYTSSSGYDPSVKYNDYYKSLVFGFGHYGDFVQLGLRFSYAMEDITNGSDFIINDGVYDNTSLNPNYTTTYSDYNETNLFLLELHINISLAIFELGRASCGGYFLRPFPLYKNCEYYW